MNLVINALPSSPGIYLMRDSSARIIYIGKAKNLKNRISSYFKGDLDNPKTVALVKEIRHIDYILASSETEALILERQLIRQYQPYFNALWKDDKSYPLIKLTVKEDFPRILIVRKKEKDGSLYFGPYPHGFWVKKLVFWLRKVFKFRPCSLQFGEKTLPKPEKVRSCLYLHTKTCPGPCVGKITSKEYKKRIKELITFLKGKIGILKDAWQKEMQLLSKEKRYEEAAEVRDRILAVSMMEEKVTTNEIKKEDLPGTLGITSKLKALKDK